jgi:glycosyltransferase involved in cell wall biosynthesis
LMKKIRILLVPDSVYWVTGTIAKNIARFNPWMEATIASGPVLDQVFAEQPELMHNFDLVHFTCPYASRQWLSRFRDLVPCVTSHHHVTDWSAIAHNVHGDAIIVGSPEWAADLRNRGVDLSRVFCVPYGVDANLFRPSTEGRKAARERLHVSDKSTVVGFFGKNSSNDDDRKGIDVFNEAVRQLNCGLKELTVLIIGPGWQELTASLTVAGVNCIWIPFVQELADLSAMYQALDFYWVTARVEGGPVTLLEAMSTQVCCLATAVGLAREIVTDGLNGVILPFNAPEAFAERTALLVADECEQRRLGKNARRTILETMEVSVTAKGVINVYAKAFENFAARRQSVLPLNVSEIVERNIDEHSVTKSAVPLNGFPRSIHKRVKMLESLAFAEHLILYHRQKWIALKMILREWSVNPLSPLPARVLLRRFLPRGVVSRVVKIKDTMRPESQLAR